MLGIALFLMGPLGATALAQTVTATAGAVNGTVSDSSGAGIRGVLVSLSGPALITPRRTISESGGVYRFPAVPTGIHTLTFERAGFTTVIQAGINVGLGFTATVNATLSPGTIGDRVTVSGAP